MDKEYKCPYCGAKLEPCRIMLGTFKQFICPNDKSFIFATEEGNIIRFTVQGMIPTDEKLKEI